MSESHVRVIDRDKNLSLLSADIWQDGCIIPFKKPYDWTSFDVVKYIKRGLPVKKIGHAGTLDPKATGLLICCTGRATKKIAELQDSTKEYEAIIRFGSTSPSLDLGTEDTDFAKWDHIHLESIQHILESDFMGEIEQLPPDFSALKVNGKRAYDLARKGVKPQLKPRNVRIESIDILSFEGQTLKLRIRCGKGTYIRSIARDLGIKLGTLARLESLCRTASGSIRIDMAWSPEDFRNTMMSLTTQQIGNKTEST